jgi:hypothetical protein
MISHPRHGFEAAERAILPDDDADADRAAEAATGKCGIEASMFVGPFAGRFRDDEERSAFRKAHGRGGARRLENRPLVARPQPEADAGTEAHVERLRGPERAGADHRDLVAGLHVEIDVGPAYAVRAEIEETQRANPGRDGGIARELAEGLCEARAALGPRRTRLQRLQGAPARQPRQGCHRPKARTARHVSSSPLACPV